MNDNSHPNLFAPILTSDALMGPLLLVARLLTTGTFVFYILNELAKIHPLGPLLYVAIAAQVLGIALVALAMLFGGAILEWTGPPRPARAEIYG